MTFLYIFCIDPTEFKYVENELQIEHRSNGNSTQLSIADYRNPTHRYAHSHFLSRYELAFKYYLLGQLTLLQLSVTTLIKQHFDFEDIFAENT